MEKLERQIEQLSQRIRRLEAERLPAGLSDEAHSLIEEFGLVPVSEHDSQILDGDVVFDIVEDLGYTCSKGTDFVLIDTDGCKIEIVYDRLPVITVINWYVLDEADDGLESLVQAAKEINHNWDMVKVELLSDNKRLMIYLDARHPGADSFRKNIRYYIDQIVGATEDLRNRYHEYERDQILKGYLRSSNQIAS